MNLIQALADLVSTFHLPQETATYAFEDTLGGYHSDPAQQRFPVGCIWGVEGQVLYTLARAIQARNVVEIGGWSGCSASHFAVALQRNGGGRVISVDNGSELSYVSGEHGSAIPDAFRKTVRLVNAEGIEWLSKQKDGSIDILFDDAAHTPEVVAGIAEQAKLKLRRGGFLVAHDAAHFRIGAQVRDGLARAGIEPVVYLIEPGDCGLAIWRAT